MPSKLNGFVTTPTVSASEVLRDLRDDRRGAGSGATTHAGGDEDHVGVLERLVDLLGVLFRRALAHGRIGSGAQAAGQLVTDADLVRRVALEERLGIGVHADELHAHHLGANHPIDGVAAPASDADDLDECEVLGIGAKRHVGWPSEVVFVCGKPERTTGLTDDTDPRMTSSDVFHNPTLRLIHTGSRGGG